MNAEIKEAFAKRRLAQKQLEDTLRNLLPTGTVVRYNHGYNEVRAEVRVPDGERVFVRGTTGRCYWLHVARIKYIEHPDDVRPSVKSVPSVVKTNPA